ncbi:DUF1329 domain-containing protein [Noviherbaspirillum sp. Root189]|uniref:DUF1329 domain-containing protein n=1 Tax=Noviherbaspirillum sp. Root189 TaxID=1736487 RepID=UPI000709AD67|nr:DUF1329 domain-containing protein [Noviherbaspirillum sp. Root189]KRB93536.1 hypothetical protein ASE07_12620 [Noviherbaspirillum sp. Root189]
MKFKTSLIAALIGSAMGMSGMSLAGVSADEAAQLGKTLTPLGGEKAGNKDGSIPAWDGGYTKPLPGFKNGERRDHDPFASEKPLYTVTAKNMDQYADKLTDGTKAMLKKYPSYRLDVYPTHRTAAAPQWVYENTLKNASRAKLDEKGVPAGAFGGIPFPIPKNGQEVMWNYLLHWRGADFHIDFRHYLITSDGKPVMTVDAQGEFSMPYYYQETSPDKWNGNYWNIRLINAGPPVRAGEAINGRLNVDSDKDQSYVYLAGQRRTRKLPNACCDTPTPATAGVMTFDELEVWSGRLDRFDWKLVGKKEVLIPYNTNKLNKPTNSADVLGANHLNPDHVRWELHRVWVVEANLKAGQRHVAPKGVYYVDEDSWLAVLGDRWDAKGQLWKSTWLMPILMPDLPAVTQISFGFNDLLSNTWFAGNLMNDKQSQYKIVTPHFPDSLFSPDALSSNAR